MTSTRSAILDGPTIQERSSLRGLAEELAEAAALSIQRERAQLWRATNRLCPERPLILADPQNGWPELVGEDDLECGDPLLREWELGLRRRLFAHRHIHDDRPLTRWFNIPWVIEVGDYGLVERQERSDEHGSYRWDAPIKTEADLDRLHPRRIEIDEAATAAHERLARDIFGTGASAILDVRRHGEAVCRAKLTRVAIHLRGLQQMMLDMYDNPQLLHRLMAFLRDDFEREWTLYEAAGALSPNNEPDSQLGAGGLGHTDLLPDLAGGPARRSQMWCWGESQETVGVGPRQFDEYVLQYQLPLLNRFGLVDYGCCEPLDNKLDLLMRYLPRLRSVAVSPWSDRRKVAEKIGAKYVFVYKPNPSRVCSPTPDWEQAERDVRETLEIAAGCCVVIVMKDTSTFHHEPARITRWTDMASRLAREAASRH